MARCGGKYKFQNDSMYWHNLKSKEEQWWFLQKQAENCKEFPKITIRNYYTKRAVGKINKKARVADNKMHREQKIPPPYWWWIYHSGWPDLADVKTW